MDGVVAANPNAGAGIRGAETSFERSMAARATPTAYGVCWHCEDTGTINRLPLRGFEDKGHMASCLFALKNIGKDKAFDPMSPFNQYVQ
jgi:hypothetical protein